MKGSNFPSFVIPGLDIVSLLPCIDNKGKFAEKSKEQFYSFAFCIRFLFFKKLCSENTYFFLDNLSVISKKKSIELAERINLELFYLLTQIETLLCLITVFYFTS